MSTHPSRVRFGPLLAAAIVGAALATAATIKFVRQPAPAIPEMPAAEAILDATELGAQLERAQKQITKLEADNLRLADRVQALSQQTSATATASPANPAKPTVARNPLAALFGDQGGTNEASKAMRGMMQAAMKQQLEGKVRALRTRLELSPEQEASVRDLLERQLDAGRAMTEKVLAGNATAEDLAAAGQQPPPSNDQIKALLTPDQQQAFDDFQKEEIRNNARLVANAELLQMQGALGLSESQQDAVYQALYSATEQQLGGGAGGPVQAMDFRGNLERKLASLRGVLSPEQLKSYEELQLQQLKLIEAMLPKNGGPGNAIVPNVQVLPHP